MHSCMSIIGDCLLYYLCLHCFDNCIKNLLLILNWEINSRILGVVGNMIWPVFIRGVASYQAEEAVASSLFCARTHARIGDRDL